MTLSEFKLENEIERLQKREVVLIESNNADMERRRQAEKERDGWRQTAALQALKLTEKDWVIAALEEKLRRADTNGK